MISGLFLSSATTELSLCWVDINTTAFSYTCESKTASDVTEARRLNQEAVLLYYHLLPVITVSEIRIARSQMTGTDFSCVGEVIARLSVHHGTQVISCRYGRCHVPRQSVSLHPPPSPRQSYSAARSAGGQQWLLLLQTAA